MKLSPPDAQRFLDLMLRLQSYVNQQAQILPKIKSFKAYCDVNMEGKIKVRDYLFGHIELIDSFVKENPDNLDEADLAIVSGWKNFIHRDFFIERMLKKFAIFMDDEDNVYSVLGLTQAPEEFIPKQNLPVRVKTILLPFEGKIVYDGFFRWYNMSFGGGIRSRLKQTYLIAKDNDNIIESLDLSSATGGATKLAKKSAKKSASAHSEQELAALLDELADKAKKLRGGGGQPATYSPIFSMVRASLELAQIATEAQPDPDQIVKKMRRLEALLGQVENAVWRTFY